MAVSPISFPTPQAYSAGADFSQLANLGNVYQKAQEDARQRQALSLLGSDPNQNAQTLLTSQSLPLAQMGINLQGQQAQRADLATQRAEQIREFEAQQKIREAEEVRRQQAADEATPEGRTAKLVAAGLDPKDPAYAAHIASGAPLPSLIQQNVDERATAQEARAKIEFQQQQKYSTREARLQAVKDGELDINDPVIRRWVALGGEIPDPAKTRLGLGQPLFARDPTTGQLHAYQPSTTGEPVEMKFPGGQIPLGPGEVAQQKAQGTATGKAVGTAVVNLPDVIRTSDTMIDSIDKIINHESKGNSLGLYSTAPDWMVTGTGVADFRERVAQLQGEAMQQNMSMLRGSGLGSVSDFEQKNMIRGFLRASQAKNQKDFDEAMQDARKSAVKIREIAQQKAKGDFSATSTAPAVTPPKSGEKPPLSDLIPIK